MQQQIKKILITGSTGFVGTNLSLYLNKLGFKTIGITRKPMSENQCGYSSLSLQHWNNALAMIHLAGKAHDLKKTSNDNEYFEVNYELTKKLYNQFLKSDCNIFIYMSSVKAVADEVESILTEKVEPLPKTAYGKSKLAAENYLLAQKLPENKKLYILRPCMIHGPGNKGNLNLLYKIVLNGIPYPLGAFTNKRSFLSIENLCFVIENLLSKQPVSGIYNVADDEAISTNTLIKIIAKGCNLKPRIWNLPKSLLIGLSKFGSAMHLPFNTDTIKKLTENYVVSNQKIKNNLKISLPISTKGGLLKTIKSFQKQQNV